MPRIVIKTAKGPKVLAPQKDIYEICMCGLSENQPFCDKSHRKTLDEKENILYTYDKEGNRTECESCEGECCGCCHDSK